MAGPNERERMDTPARLRDRPGQPRTAPPALILGGRESNSARKPATPPAGYPTRKGQRSPRLVSASGGKRWHQVACVANPATILAWYRKLIAKKFDGSKPRRYLSFSQTRSECTPRQDLSGLRSRTRRNR